VREYKEREQKRQKLEEGTATETKSSTNEEEIKPIVPFEACLEQVMVPT
jgi:hypothetical protein